MNKREILLRDKEEYISSSDISKFLRMNEMEVSRIYGTMYILYRREIERLKAKISLLRKYEKGEIFYNREVIPYMISIVERRDAGERNIILPIYAPIAIYATKKE